MPPSLCARTRRKTGWHDLHRSLGLLRNVLNLGPSERKELRHGPQLGLLPHRVFHKSAGISPRIQLSVDLFSFPGPIVPACIEHPISLNFWQHPRLQHSRGIVKVNGAETDSGRSRLCCQGAAAVPVHQGDRPTLVERYLAGQAWWLAANRKVKRTARLKPILEISYGWEGWQENSQQQSSRLRNRCVSSLAPTSYSHTDKFIPIPSKVDNIEAWIKQSHCSVACCITTSSTCESRIHGRTHGRILKQQRIRSRSSPRKLLWLPA